jgi:pyrrolysine biosynthesis protein PylC
VAVVGGNLQGVEAAYLAAKAGWEVLVVDRKPVVPAKGLTDRFFQLDVTAETKLSRWFKDVDLVIPALENEAALKCLHQWAQAEEMPFTFDPAAYAVSCSKTRSNEFFSRTHVPIPLPWPACGLPVVAKPSGGSGSRGVKVFYDAESLRAQLNESTEEWVLQEFVQGPSYSIEVLGWPGRYFPLQVTDLQMDKHYDCKRVLAPTDLPEALMAEFKRISISLAEALGLKGLMDVEVILQHNLLKVLEIDARLPSQTPTAVYWSSGLNMVAMLADLFLKKPIDLPEDLKATKAVIYEHIKVSPNLLEIGGEHLRSGTAPLHVVPHFFGTDEALTNFTPGEDNWTATLIFSENSRRAVWEKRNGVIKDIRRHFGLKEYRDSAPRESGQGELS